MTKDSAAYFRIARERAIRLHDMTIEQKATARRHNAYLIATFALFIASIAFDTLY